MLSRLHGAELPLAAPDAKGILGTVDESFTFYFRSNSPLETNCAVADVRADSAEIWSSLKIPILAQQDIAKNLGLPQGAVTCHVVQGGGSFGRHLFSDAAIEAAEASRAFGNKPVRLMWHRTDDFRHGRVHPMCTQRVRATYGLGGVLTYEQRTTSVATDFTHGLGELLTSVAAHLPGGGNYSFAQSIYLTTQTVSYNYGITDQLLNEIYPYDKFHTGSMRNVYSPDVRVAQELVTDRLAEELHMDAYAFRRKYLKDHRARAVLDKAAQAGQLGAQAARAHGAGHRRAPRVQGIRGLCRGDRLPSCDGESPRSRTPTPARGSRRLTYVVDVGCADQPARPGGTDAGRDHGRHRAGADIQPALAQRPLPRRQLGRLLVHPPVERPARGQRHRHAGDQRQSPAAPASSASQPRRRPSRARTAARPGRCRPVSRSTTTSRSASSRCRPTPSIPPSPINKLQPCLLSPRRLRDHLPPLDQRSGGAR